MTESQLRAWVVSKTAVAGAGTAVVFSDEQFRQLTGHSFERETDFVYLMNGNEMAAGVNGPGTFTTPSYNMDEKTIFTWTIGSNGANNGRNGTVRMNILVVSTA